MIDYIKTILTVIDEPHSTKRIFIEPNNMNISMSIHATVQRRFSKFVTQQQGAHERRFPPSRTILNIMNVYWDHAKTQPDLLEALNYFRPSQDMKLYRLILKVCNKVTIALLQCLRNVQTIT